MQRTSSVLGISLGINIVSNMISSHNNIDSRGLKVAVIICGQMRGLEHKSVPTINKRIIEANNADVFFASWKTRPEKAAKFFKQKNANKVEVKEADVNFKNLKSVGLFNDIDVDRFIHPSRLTGILPHGILFNLILINNALRGMVSHENENGFKYDIVVKTRPDLRILSDLKCVNNGSLNLSRNCTNRKQASDKLYYADRSLFFSFIDKLTLESNILSEPFDVNLPWRLQPIGERFYKQVILKYKMPTRIIKGRHVLLR